eukprot:6777710-Prymnesium_polylepis.2
MPRPRALLLSNHRPRTEVDAMQHCPPVAGPETPAASLLFVAAREAAMHDSIPLRPARTSAAQDVGSASRLGCWLRFPTRREMNRCTGSRLKKRSNTFGMFLAISVAAAAELKYCGDASPAIMPEQGGGNLR